MILSISYLVLRQISRDRILSRRLNPITFHGSTVAHEKHLLISHYQWKLPCFIVAFAPCSHIRSSSDQIRLCTSPLILSSLCSILKVPERVLKSVGESEKKRQGSKGTKYDLTFIFPIIDF